MSDTQVQGPSLPDKPSELIRLALADLRKVENDAKYVVDMGVWHEPYTAHHPGETARRSACLVCLAGAVMAGTLASPVNKSVDPDAFISNVSNKLLALNGLRHAHLFVEMREAARRGGFRAIRWTVQIPVYAFDREGFHRVLNLLANAFEADGQ